MSKLLSTALVSVATGFLCAHELESVDPDDNTPQLGGVDITVPSRFDRFDFAAAVGIESRLFLEDPAYPGQFRDAFQPSITFQPELEWASESGRHQFVLAPYGRYDLQDGERSHWDIREGYWFYAADSWEVLVGADKVFWGVTESRHLVDIINQSDGVEDIDEEDKLGQPMIKLATIQTWGTLAVYAMPYFRERTFAGIGGRLRGALPVDVDSPVYESSEEEWNIDLALRYSQPIGPVDLGLHAFHGTSREPRLELAGDSLSLVPHYDLITQGGIDLQYTGDTVLLKGEAIVREGQGSTFVAASAGFEYTLFQIFATGADLGLLAEYHYDGRGAGAPATFFDNDIFLGARIALNDMEDTAFLVGGISDLDTGATVLSVEAQRRLGDSWVAELEARLLLETGEAPLLSSFSDDSFATLRLTRYF